jgi:uncharacterized membrane protein
VKTAVAASSGRKGYLDWLRGVGVLVMVQGHVMNSWTAMADRNRDVYHWISFVSGIGGAALFLFLAGVGMVLGASTRMKRGRSEADSAAAARRRGWQIFGLAFLFRLQSWLISGGPPRTLLKVDVLNVMGPSMIAAALIWGVGGDRWRRTALFVSATVATAMLTPLVRASELLSALPDPAEWYLRPAGSATTFTLFPWAGFLLAGCAAGVWLDTSAQGAERRATLGLTVAGGLLVLAGYGASLLPPIYAVTNFWTSSPTFFCIRLGILMMLVGVAYLWHARWVVPGSAAARPVRSPLQELGRSSLFVYWIHVEMTYGVMSAALHRRLPLEWAWVAFLLFSVALYWLVRLKERIKTMRPAGGTRLTMAPSGVSRS